MASSWREPGWRWFIEWTSEGEGMLRRIEKVLVSKKTIHQELEVMVLSGIGKSLILDGKVQSSISDEYWYHEALVHPVLLAIDCPHKVLILGGGEGATLREVLKHNCVKRVVMVDLDREVIEVSKEHLHEWHQGSFSDPRATIVISDGKEFLENTKERFDAIIIDLVDPLEETPAANLYTEEFYRLVKTKLSSQGIMVTQATSPIFTPHIFVKILRALSKVFAKVDPYVTYVRSYNGLWGLVAASDYKVPSELNSSQVAKLLPSRLGDKIKSLKFYDPKTHIWLFNPPKPLRSLWLSER